MSGEKEKDQSSQNREGLRGNQERIEPQMIVCDFCGKCNTDPDVPLIIQASSRNVAVCASCIASMSLQVMDEFRKRHYQGILRQRQIRQAMARQVSPLEPISGQTPEELTQGREVGETGPETPDRATVAPQEGLVGQDWQDWG